jgi:hypothetical protein
MKIDRNDIVGEGLNPRIWILDFQLTNSEALAAASIETLLATRVALLQPPFGAILAALLVAEAQNILAANTEKRGVGANIHFQVIPLKVPAILGLIQKKYFSL